jgi:nucleotide-binding universal stress UspA family protein
MKILLAIDSSACSEAAVDEVARRPWPAETEVYLISVVELPFAPTDETHALPDSYYSQLEKTGQEQAHAAINQAIERLGASQDASLKITSSIIIGHPEEVILAEAEAWGADLIVLGSHGYRGWKQWLLRSVSQAVAARASCPVEIVRCRQANNSVSSS